MARQECKNQFYYCEECKMVYAVKKRAHECEEWCKKHKSCNIEITKHSLSLKGGSVK